MTIGKANGLLNHLNSTEFLYWLKFFYFIMPHITIFLNQLQTRGIDSVQIQNTIKEVEKQIALDQILIT